VIVPEGIPWGAATSQSVEATAKSNMEPDQDDSGAPIESAAPHMPNDGKVRKGQVIRVTFGRIGRLDRTNKTDESGND